MAPAHIAVMWISRGEPRYPANVLVACHGRPRLLPIRKIQTDADLAVADAVWQSEIGKAFGDDRIDAYAALPAGQGTPDTALRCAYEARMRALEAWRLQRDHCG